MGLTSLGKLLPQATVSKSLAEGTRPWKAFSEPPAKGKDASTCVQVVTPFGIDNA
jgi:hypothetical protein